MMTNLAKTLLGLASVMGTVAVSPQTPPAPRITLTISQGMSSSMFPKGTQIINVQVTNISSEVIREGPCAAFGALYKLDVVYNGVPQEEPEAKRKRREFSEAVESGKEAGLCEGSNPGRALKPGEYWKDPIYYQAKKPGTYHFTVEEKSFPEGGGEGVTVKSNTLTIVVPPTDVQAVPQ